ncbi:MAG: cytochrome c oxidase assembly protein, partial [Acidobacteria bacterium]|nr:cytochrome c oxidase assembly protein [Acidobacteriota bacterium]
MKRAASISICALVFVASVSAHAGHEHTQQEVLSTWTFDPLVVLALAFSAVLYSIGIRNLWREAGTGSAVSVRGALLYVCGWLSLFVALVSPVHAWGEVLFSAHMTQHEILMLISAPLIVLGRPLIAFMWALPRDVRKAIGDMTKTSGAARVWSFLTNPTAAFLIHGFA